ncbi:MAG: CAP domain-containing protein [Verrucomicrobiales bacterium]|jgi:uncharacterized protein YkwD
MQILPFLLLSLATLIFAANCSHHSSADYRSPTATTILNAPVGDSTSNYERHALRLTNQERQRHGLRPLRHNAQLALAAKRHSAVMAKHGYVGHHEPGGTDSSMKRSRKAGYKPQRVGENVYGPRMSMSAIDHAILGPDDAVKSWMESPGHRRNLLDPKMKEVGHGYVNGFWTQVLGAPDRYEAEKVAPNSRPRGTLKKPAPEAFNWTNL